MEIILNSNIKTDRGDNKQEFWKNYISGSQIKNIIDSPFKEYNIKLGKDKRLFSKSSLNRMRWGTLVEDKILELAKSKYGFCKGEKLGNDEEVVVDKRTFKRMDIPFGANVDALIIKNKKIEGIIEIKNTTIADFDKLLEYYKLQMLHYCYVLGAKYVWLVAKIPTDEIISIKLDYEKEKHHYEKWINFLLDFATAVSEKNEELISELEFNLTAKDVTKENPLPTKEEVIEIEKLATELYKENKVYNEAGKKIKAIKEQLKLYVKTNYIQTFEDISFKAYVFNRSYINNEQRIVDICKKVNIDATQYTDDKYKKQTQYLVYKVSLTKK